MGVSGGTAALAAGDEAHGGRVEGGDTGFGAVGGRVGALGDLLDLGGFLLELGLLDGILLCGRRAAASCRRPLATLSADLRAASASLGSGGGMGAGAAWISVR